MQLRPAKRLRILDFDIETRRVGFFSSGKFKPDGCEPIAIACSVVGESRVEVVLLSDMRLPDMLAWFADRYDQADLVTGHYVKKFDLPILSGSLLEHHLPKLPPKLVSDTQQDLIKRAGLSASQENLGAMYGLKQGKLSVSDHEWRGAARLDPKVMETVRKRVVSDVQRHKALRKRLIAEGALRPPRVWSA